MNKKMTDEQRAGSSNGQHVNDSTTLNIEELALHVTTHLDCLMSNEKWESYDDKPYTTEFMERFLNCSECRMRLVEWINRYLLILNLDLLKECAGICDKAGVSQPDQTILAGNINLMAHLTDHMLRMTAMYGANTLNKELCS